MAGGFDLGELYLQFKIKKQTNDAYLMSDILVLVEFSNYIASSLMLPVKISSPKFFSNSAEAES
jgi:hypothetical protein